MISDTKPFKKIGIIGGGISGLTAAFLLKKKGFNVTLFEKSGRVGGNIQTVEVDGFRIEYAPNSLLKSPRLVDLIKALNLESEVLKADANNKKRYVLQNGKLKALPMTLAKMATGDYFSMKAKMRLLKEPFVRSKSPENESVAEFFERRLGREIVERAADPFIAGIYAGNPANLSVRAAFPRLYELEKEYGSLLAGSLLSKSEKAPKDFPRTFSFKRGVQTLTERLAEKLGNSVKTNAQVKRIEKHAGGKWLVATDSGEEIFDALVISAPAETAAKLIENLDSNLSARLRQIYYPPVAMVFFCVKKEFLAQNLDGFGFLIPSAERRQILGTIWNSAVFAGRAPEGYHLLTTFVGGARNAATFEKSDAELYEIVFDELKSILGLRVKPDLMHIKRWRKAIPQYLLGYERIERGIEEFERVNRGIHFCSNFYKGISVGDCVKNAYRTAEKISRE
ncbi:MAG: oxygen-dependent protoporphyrinogen oxidase [Acidobacteria bacterium]|nr:oxygen-dependent protoporphyrinogen oxidase [Acidobacteriota bacterium]